MNGSVLRILDANFNRAREALRVVEDYARFVLDDDKLCTSLKHLRHELTDATKPLIGDAILHRDTPGDVGTVAKTRAEFVRDDSKDVVVAAGKRLGEALRTIEEYLKTVDAERAARVETARYAFYDLEQQIALTLRPAACGFAEQVRLYVLITEASCRIPWRDAAHQAIDGGADCLQLREKSLDSGELLRRAKDFVALCRKHNVVSIINDRPDIATMSDADGVHVGQGDLPARDVRELIGNNKIVGVSTHELSHAKQAVLDGADYIGVGPVFVSNTKRRDFVAGLNYAREVVQANLPIPAVAIAGITAENVDEVLKTGIKAVAVTASIIGCDDVKEAAIKLKRAVLSSA